MGRVGILEALVVIVVILLLFGAGKLPAIGGALGRAVRELRRAWKGKPSNGESEKK